MGGYAYTGGGCLITQVKITTVGSPTVLDVVGSSIWFLPPPLLLLLPLKSQSSLAEVRTHNHKEYVWIVMKNKSMTVPNTSIFILVVPTLSSIMLARMSPTTLFPFTLRRRYLKRFMLSRSCRGTHLCQDWMHGCIGAKAQAIVLVAEEDSRVSGLFECIANS